MVHKVYLGLGSNQGDRAAKLARAIELIGERVGPVTSGNKFLNCAIYCETTLLPRQVLQVTQQIERELGRHYKGKGYRDRPIDIDILLFDELHIETPNLQIPHPLMYERDFVMIPLKEIKQ